MKRILLLGLFIIGLGFALFNFSGMANRGEFESIIIDFREDIPTINVSQELSAIAQKYQQQPTLNSIFSINDHVYIVEGDRKLLKQLKKSSLKQKTEYIEPNYIYQALEVPNDPEYPKQWNFRSINIEQAWDETKGTGITVAVIDTGVTKVPDLKITKFTEGYDFVNDRTEASDDNGHGTHVAGTIAQSTNNAYGVAGIAYESTIMPLKVLSGSGGGTVADIAEAIKFAADHNANVINLSLGGSGESNLLKEAVDYAYNKGVVVIAAAGNSNQNSAAYPARYPHVISVAATDSTGEKAPYSNYGAGVDISAPGGSETGKILQNTIDPSTGESVFVGFQGTSMAAPHVAGVAALVQASGVTEPAEVLKVLKQSARKLQEDPLNHFGAGHLDAGAAVKLALKGQITFKDFFRWLRDNGYLNPRFWIDGGAIALLPKIAMVLGSYLLAWVLRNYLPFNLSLQSGLIFGSSGLFFLQGLYVFDLPQWPMRLFGSSLPELGNTVVGSATFNPLFASVLIPFALISFLSGHQTLKWFAIGSSLGVAACLGISAVVDPAVWGLGSNAIAQGFLAINAILCFGLAYLASQGEKQKHKA
ncbi:Thermitase [Stanieria cyanosphaera PCC 7437]|uniref:Thermitase n=1 Tax=Stanieria cyanosphaera (strain ATCC 29371 / PCC 7437) TaxID=111780 RepID=K9XRT9_STAC7|nr:S8 family peptidase [Stanieria cyanosphaera]AFZ35325.1 Thermitase [Stanieria cyanosphaera PCC 7437]